MSHHNTCPSVEVENTSEPVRERKRWRERERDGVYSKTCFGGGEDDLVDWLLVADLDGRDLQALGAFPRVKEGQLAVVAAAHQQVGVLGVVLQTEEGRGRPQNLLRLVGVLWQIQTKDDSISGV